jgi:hypothetical protein
MLGLLLGFRILGFEIFEIQDSGNRFQEIGVWEIWIRKLYFSERVQFGKLVFR